MRLLFFSGPCSLSFVRRGAVRPLLSMDLLIRISFSAAVVLSTAALASGQTSSELRAKYGAPETVELENGRVAVERFLVRPTIQVTIRYTNEGKPGEAVIKPVANSTRKTGVDAYEDDRMDTSEVIKVIDELLPPEKRGKKLGVGSFNGGDPQMKLHHPGCTGFDFIDFENATVSAASSCRGGTYHVTIRWGKPSFWPADNTHQIIGAEPGSAGFSSR